MPKISVVIPVFYNEESLPFLFDELLKIEKSLLEKGMALEIICVDDGSGDNSLRELLKIKQHRPTTRIINLPGTMDGLFVMVEFFLINKLLASPLTVLVTIPLTFALSCWIIKERSPNVAGP